MIGVARRDTCGLSIRLSTLEFAGCAFAMFIYTGALFPLFLSGPDGSLDPAARSMLRATQFPAYAITLALAFMHLRAVLRVAQRNIAFTLLCFMSLVSVLWSIGGALSLRRAIALLLSMLLAYVLAARFTPRRFLFLAATVLGACMLGSLLFYVGAPGLGRMPLSDEVRGVFLHKNVLGWYSAVASIIFACVARDRDRRVSQVGMVFLAVSLACLLLSRSATGLFVVITAGGLSLFYVTFARLRGLSRLLLVVVFAQCVVAFLLVSIPLSAYVLEAIDKDPTLTGRIPLWQEIDPWISDRWVFGHGFQAFWDVGSPAAWQIWSVVGWQAPHAHNGARDVLLSLGVVGLALLAFAVLRGLKQGASLLSGPGGNDWLWLNLYAATFVAMNLTESLYLAQNDLLFILFAAALVLFSNQSSRRLP